MHPPFQTDEVIKLFPAERVPERTVEQIVDMPVPQIQEQIVEVAEIIPQERTSEHTVGVPAPLILEEVVEVVKAVKIVPQERISAKICEQIVGATVPHAVDELVSPFQEETVEVIKLFREERTPKRIM